MKTNYYSQAKEEKTILSLSLLMNPFYLMFTNEDGLDFIQELHLFENCKTDVDSPYEASFYIYPPDLDQPTDEEIFKPTAAHQQKRIAMFNTFKKPYSENFSDSEDFFESEFQFKPKSYPIGKITFFLSALIASNSKRRQAFYERYTGPIPIITQFLFTYLRIGSLPDGNVIWESALDDEYYNIKHFKHYIKGTMLDINKKDEKGQIIDTDLIVAWFIKLYEVEQIEFGQEKSSYFSHYTLLDAIPLESNETVLLSGLTVNNNVLSWYTSGENLNPVFQDCCLMVSMALDLKLIHRINRAPKPTEKEFHYLRNSIFKTISKNGLFSNFLPFIFSLDKEVLCKDK